MAPVLGYWKIRGLAQPIRLLLAYIGLDYEDKLYEYGPPPEYHRRNWMDVKYSLGLQFPNLPYYIDADKNIKLTQSVAIIRYLARNHGLDAETDDQKLKADVIEQEISDFRMMFVRLCYNPDFENLKAGVISDLQMKVEQFSKFLGKQEWIAGDKITYVDFLMYDVLDAFAMLSPGSVDKHENLTTFLKRFEVLPAIKKYMSSPKFMKWPLNGDMAVFGSRSQKMP